MYVRIEKHTGFRVKGFRTNIVSTEDIGRARKRLMSMLEQQHKYPRVTYGVFFSKENELLNVDTYFAGIIGDSSVKIDSKEEVIVSSGRYVIAVGDHENYDTLDLLKLIRETNYFNFRAAPIVESYSRNIETGKESIELWVPIED